MTHVQNPVMPGCHPDPSVCRVGDDFYLVTSTFEYLPGLPVLRSRDLATWEHVGDVVDRSGQLDYDGIRSSGGLFAPTLRHHDGTFWLVCTLVDPDDDSRGGNFVMTATDPAGPWSDPVWLRDEDGERVAGIDPSIFFDDDGRVWLHGTRLAPEPEWFHQTEVWVRELDPATCTLVGPEHVVWTGAVRGAVWAEGPHLYKVDGTYYLLASEGGTDFHHAVSVARASSVTGPYEGNKANPVLTHRHLGRGVDVVGVGHADLVEAPDGSTAATTTRSAARRSSSPSCGRTAGPSSRPARAACPTPSRSRSRARRPGRRSRAGRAASSARTTRAGRRCAPCRATSPPRRARAGTSRSARRRSPSRARPRSSACARSTATST